MSHGRALWTLPRRHAETIRASRRWRRCRLVAGRLFMDRRDFNNALTVAGFAGGVVALGALITVMLAFG